MTGVCSGVCTPRVASLYVKHVCIRPSYFDATRPAEKNQLASRQGHEGPGSLLSYLKKQNWATALGVDASSTTDDFTMFEVQ